MEKKELQPQAPAKKEPEGGQSMTPPAFGLTASPIQTKTLAGNGAAGGPDPAAAPKEPTLADKLAAIDDPKNAKVKKEKVKEMMAFVRAQEATWPAMISSYKDQPTPVAAEKVRVIGEIAALVARAEWLIGSIYLEGSDDKKKWETGTNNDKDKVLAGYYQKQTASDSKELGDDPWCTKFLGVVKKNALGLHNKKGGKPNGELWSGYKLGNGDNFDYGTEKGGMHVGRGPEGHAKGKDQNVWVNYRTSLEKEKDAKKREALADTFLTEKIRPQAGDNMVVKRTSAAANSFDKKSQSHTTMIERLEGRTLYTIEGNASDRVLGRSYDLTDATDVGKIVFISRFSLDAYGEVKKPLKKGEVEKPWAGTEVTEVDLKAPMTTLVEGLTTYAQEKDYIKKPKEGDLNVVKNLQKEDGDGKST
jgi:hypothetical protein